MVKNGLFLAGVLATGVGIHTAVGAVAGGFELARRALLVIGLATLVPALVYHMRGAKDRFPGSRHGVQANRDWAERGALGLVYFGALLGTGVITQLATPFVYTAGALAASAGPAVGAAYGAGFAIGRSTPAFYAALRRSGEDAGATVLRYSTAGRAGRLMTAAVTLLLILGITVAAAP